MIRFLVTAALSLALLSGRAGAQQTVNTRTGILARRVIASVQGTPGGAIDTGYVSVVGCRNVQGFVKNTGTVNSTTGQTFLQVAGVAYGDTAGIQNLGSVVAGGAGLAGFPNVTAPGFVDAVRVTYPATANVTLLVVIVCLY